MKSQAKKKSQRHAIDADLLWRVAWTYIRTVIDTAHEPFLVLDEHMRVLSANKTFYRFFKVKRKDTEQTLVYDLGDGQWNIPALRKLLEKILPKSTYFVDYHVDHDFPGIGRKVLLLNARRIYSATEKVPIILLAMKDITKQKELEEKLRDFATKLNAAVSVRTKELEQRVRLLEARARS
jgi:two-component system, cell cycle sensor histidine kinase PleC